MPEFDPTRAPQVETLVEKQRVQNTISENKILESYIRGENYVSTDEAITAYRFNLESKESKLKELDGIINQLKSEEDNFKTIIKKKQKEYQKEVSRRDSRRD